MSTITLNRERRKTSGRRMNELVGEALEQDDAFWGHETWNDDTGDSGNESFRESDEDSALRKDEFDSDFDDSESDNEDEEAAAGEAEERELLLSERASSNKQRGTGAYVDSKSKRGRGGRPAGVRRIVGEGFNKGIVLNFPPSAAPLVVASTDDTLAIQEQRQQQHPPTSPIPSTTVSAQPSETTHKRPPSQSTKSSSVSSVTSETRKRSSRRSAHAQADSTRERRLPHGTRTLRDHRSTPGTSTSSSVQEISNRKSAAASSAAAASRAAKRRRYAQEELLLEAVHQTEPENKRWLHGRKRVQDQHDRDLNASNTALRDKSMGKVVQKFHSRRGALTTLTFPEMDAVPEILTRQPTARVMTNDTDKGSADGTIGSADGTINPSHPPQGRAAMTLCVITGKPARYRDPRTNLPYYDLAAFKELRRQHETKGFSNKMEIYKLSVDSTLSKSTTDSTPDQTAERPKVNHNNTHPNNLLESSGNKQKKKPKSARSSIAIPNNGKKSESKPKAKPKPKKPSNNASKLPFQSPKPPSDTVHKKENESTLNGSKVQAGSAASVASSSQQNSAAALLAQQSPIVEKLAFSWGDTPSGLNSNGSESPLSPSGRRLSPRKWKPSEKILETIATSPSKDGVTTTPAGMKITTQRTLEIEEGSTLAVTLLAPDITTQSTSNSSEARQEFFHTTASTAATATATTTSFSTNAKYSNHETKTGDPTSSDMAIESSLQQHSAVTYSTPLTGNVSSSHNDIQQQAVMVDNSKPSLLEDQTNESGTEPTASTPAQAVTAETSS